jgi:hypothetical protein
MAALRVGVMIATLAASACEGGRSLPRRRERRGVVDRNVAPDPAMVTRMRCLVAP